MVYVEVEGEPHIFAVQTILNNYMPKALKLRLESAQRNNKLVDSLSVFAKRLDDLRVGLNERKQESIFELAAFAGDFLDGLLRTSASRKSETPAKMELVKTVPAMTHVRDTVSRRNKVLPTCKTDRLALKLKYVDELYKPLPNKFISVHSGRKTHVSVVNQPSVFAVLSKDQLSQLEDVVLEFELCVKDGQPYLTMTMTKRPKDNLKMKLYVDEQKVSPGIAMSLPVGGTLCFGDILSFRVGSLKI
jgi:hypothetical protein